MVVIDLDRAVARDLERSSTSGHAVLPVRGNRSVVVKVGEGVRDVGSGSRVNQKTICWYVLKASRSSTEQIGCVEDDRGREHGVERQVTREVCCMRHIGV